MTAPIIGATRPQHLTEAISALDVQPDDVEVAELEESYVTRKPVGHR